MRTRTRVPRLKKLMNFRNVHGCGFCQGNCYHNFQKFRDTRTKENTRAMMFEWRSEWEE